MHNQIDNSGLVDIRDVAIDKSMSKKDRVAEFLRQIKDPHRFKCGQFTVSVKYADNGTTIEDCLRGIVN
jgi:hypothetical protein